jgi:hypothetical protein
MSSIQRSTPGRQTLWGEEGIIATTPATGGISREISAMRETATRTAVLVSGISKTIHSRTEISGQRSQHAEELAGAVDSSLAYAQLK